jgi:radical SAM family uncharacterized protein
VIKTSKQYAEAETGAIRKDWRGRTRIALVYPNQYRVGMSNLGFQTVYLLLNNIEYVVCERAFLPDDGKSAGSRIVTIESQRPVTDFDIIAFSVSFESDFLNILSFLKIAGLPILAKKRRPDHPLVIAGGVACFLNPEPAALFIDCFLLGEAEVLLPDFCAFFDRLILRSNEGKTNFLLNIAKNLPGVYVPEFYRPFYDNDGTLKLFEPLCEAPVKIKRVYLHDLSNVSTCSAALTPYTSFKKTFLIETGRGCTHGCRFCSAGYIYRPPRYRTVSALQKSIREGLELTDRISFVGAAVSDLPEIGALCSEFKNDNIRISFSSLRADALTEDFLSVLKQSRVKTATIAPDAGSQRMRDVINKGITEEDILDTVERLVGKGIPNLKLYFMIGLPHETFEDIKEIARLCKKIKDVFLKSSRTRGRIGRITLSINPFVPKPFTPFQWSAMDEERIIKKKINCIKAELKKTANLRINVESPRRAYIQAMISRGDRRMAEILLKVLENRGNWPKTLKESQFNPDFFVYRERHNKELFPWDFIDHGIKKSFLRNEYNLAGKNRTSPPCRVGSCSLCGVCPVSM